MEFSKVLVAVFISTLFVLTIYMTVTGKLKQKPWIALLLAAIAIAALFFRAGAKEALIYYVQIALVLMIWLLTENLYKQLNGRKVDRLASLSGHISILIISGLLLFIFRHVLYPSMALFLNHLVTLIEIPKLMSVITTFGVVYIAVILLFGLLYAILHIKINAGFSSARPLKLQDFFFFSAFNIVTQGYKDMIPDHWLISFLSLIQIFVGIVLLGIYLAGAFTYIVSP